MSYLGQNNQLTKGLLSFEMHNGAKKRMLKNNEK